MRKLREAELRGQARKKQPEVLLVGLDGGWVKSREHKRGMEGKVRVLVSEIDPVVKRGRRRMSCRRYIATFQNSSVLGQLAYVATCALGAQEVSRQVVVGDGADWIKTEADLHFPQAVKILDWAESRAQDLGRSSCGGTGQKQNSARMA